MQSYGKYSNLPRFPQCPMIIIQQPDAVSSKISSIRQSGKKIGFVPTMGALHEGHLSLLRAAQSICDITVCSIFVNPTQFNNPDDLLKYPRTPEKDLALLEEIGCDIVFMPEADELYAMEKPMQIDIRHLESRFEGASRPGHFQGVCRVVNLFFQIVQPDDAFFGLKDFQQCMVIQSMVEQLHLPIRLHFQPTLREEDGLAMSSRNIRLNEAQRKAAPIIYKALCFLKEKMEDGHQDGSMEEAKAIISSEKELKIDYLEIADARTLAPYDPNNVDMNPVALAAVYDGEVRLIDNLLLK